jgi:hypothetical protein
MKVRWEIENQQGNTVSSHRTYEAALRKHTSNLGYHCGICGSHRRGWGQCSHSQQNWVCSANHYNDRIVGYGEDGSVIR